MTNEMIKKALNEMLKKNGWNKCYGAYGLGLTAGAKQLEKRNAVIGFGYLEDDRYDAEDTYNKFINSKEFCDVLEKINATYVREEKKDNNLTEMRIRIYF